MSKCRPPIRSAGSACATTDPGWRRSCKNSCSNPGSRARPGAGGWASPWPAASWSNSMVAAFPIILGSRAGVRCLFSSFRWRHDSASVMTSPLQLNPAQREAVEYPEGPLLVLAGAGSGKTRVLTARIAHLITQHEVLPQRIFAVTFTNKAAGEMRSRVAQLLGNDPRGLWIGTFHSLSARLLRREAPLLGFGPNFTIYDADDSEALVKRLLEVRQ